MPKRKAPRAFWLLIALALLGPPIVSFALQSSPDLLRGIVQGIPEPQPVVIRPRLFVAYGALIAACTLAILYLYRGRGFVVYWILSWTMLAASDWFQECGRVTLAQSDPSLASAASSVNESS